MIAWLRDRLAGSSPRFSPMTYKATLVSFVVLAFIIPLGLVAIPFIEFFNGMAAQPKAKAQSTYGRVHGEQLLTDRLPAEGTIPRGHLTPLNESFGNTIEDARQVGTMMSNPLPMTLANMQRGRELFNRYCATCHGESGQGNGPVTGVNPVTGAARYPAPPSLHTDQARSYADGAIYHIITKGIGQMPAYDHMIDQHERWQIVQYLDALQLANQPREDDGQQ